ncbi:hypothetical protein ACNQ2K_02980 [Mycoplasma sp. VS292A]|uniref:hypothetical protein n=1 Tax=unclassified Mycoplasma TaxID=2683645 RepID=UPI003AB0556B
MKLKTLSIINLLNGPATIGNSVAPTPNISVLHSDLENDNTIKTPEGDALLSQNELESLKNISQYMANTTNATIKKLSEKMSDTKISAKKFVESISDTDKNDIYNLYIEGIKQSDLSSDKKKEILSKLESNKDEFQKKFVQNAKEQFISYKKELKKAKKESQYKNTVTKIERIQTTDNPSWAINDDGSINSKLVVKEYYDLKRKVNLVNEQIKPLNENIQTLEIINATLVSSMIVISATAAGLYIASFFCPPCLLAATALTAVGAILSVISISITNRINTLNDEYNKLNSLITTFNSSISISIVSMITAFPTLLKKSTDIIKNANLLIDAGEDALFGTQVLGAGAALLKAGIDSYKLYEISKEIIMYQNHMKELDKLLFDFSSNLSKIEKVEWVVVDETPLDKKYDEGGIGGKNTVFKNLKTGEVKTLDQMLKMSKIQLYSYGLIKVHSQTRGWYIKKLPNKIKEDNLG